jgi:hypothetical protein
MTPKGLLLFLGCLLFDYFSAAVGSTEMANFVCRLEIVTLRTWDKGSDKHAEMAASFALPRFGVFPFG